MQVDGEVGEPYHQIPAGPTVTAIVADLLRSGSTRNSDVGDTYQLLPFVVAAYLTDPDGCFVEIVQSPVSKTQTPDAPKEG
jgi:hypothetical protein